MNTLDSSDLEFSSRFVAGDLRPQDFSHSAHLRLAYIHLVTHGPEKAVTTFRESLLVFMRHHQIDPLKFHETLTQAWLQAVWYFMRRCGDTAGSEEFLRKSTVLQDSKVMMTHYSREVLFSDRARIHFIAPDLDPIPQVAAGDAG